MNLKLWTRLRLRQHNFLRFTSLEFILIFSVWYSNRIGLSIFISYIYILLEIKILQVQSKVESQLARISRLRKFVISKSQNSRIWITHRLRGQILDGFFDLKSTKFSPYDILSKTGNLLLFHWIQDLWTSTFHRDKGNTKTRKPLICLQKLINSSLMKLKLQTR